MTIRRLTTVLAFGHRFVTSSFYELSVCEKAPTHKSVTVITGVAAYPLIKELCDAAHEKYGIDVQTEKIINNFFRRKYYGCGASYGN